VKTRQLAINSVSTRTLCLEFNWSPIVKSVASIGHVHVDDMADKPGELSNCNADRTLPGAGCLDLGQIFGRLEAFGYAGCFSIEMFDEDLWAMPATIAAKRMYASLLPLCSD